MSESVPRAVITSLADRLVSPNFWLVPLLMAEEFRLGVFCVQAMR
jgi:hypothetical protein